MKNIDTISLLQRLFSSYWTISSTKFPLDWSENLNVGSHLNIINILTTRPGAQIEVVVSWRALHTRQSAPFPQASHTVLFIFYILIFDITHRFIVLKYILIFIFISYFFEPKKKTLLYSPLSVPFPPWSHHLYVNIFYICKL